MPTTHQLPPPPPPQNHIKCTNNFEYCEFMAANHLPSSCCLSLLSSNHFTGGVQFEKIAMDFCGEIVVYDILQIE